MDKLEQDQGVARISGRGALSGDKRQIVRFLPSDAV